MTIIFIYLILVRNTAKPKKNYMVSYQATSIYYLCFIVQSLISQIGVPLHATALPFPGIDLSLLTPIIFPYLENWISVFKKSNCDVCCCKTCSSSVLATLGNPLRFCFDKQHAHVPVIQSVGQNKMALLLANVHPVQQKRFTIIFFCIRVFALLLLQQ